MRHHLLSIELFLIICCFFSCSKDEKIKNTIEGTWGLVHIEQIVTLDGVTQEAFKEDFNPFNPVGDFNLSIDLINTTGNDYCVTIYVWNAKKAIWEYGNKTTWTIDSDGVFMSPENSVLLNGKTYILKNRPISLTSDSFTLDSYYKEKLNGTEFGKSGIVEVSISQKLVFRKMSNLSDAISKMDSPINTADIFPISIVSDTDLDGTSWEIMRSEDLLDGNVVNSYSEDSGNVVFIGNRSDFKLSIDFGNGKGPETFTPEDIIIVRANSAELVFDMYYYEYDNVLINDVVFYTTYMNVKIYKGRYLYNGKYEDFYCYFKPNGVAVDVASYKYQGETDIWWDSCRYYCRRSS